MLSWQTANVSGLPQFSDTFEGSTDGENILHVELRLNLKKRVNSLLHSFCPNLNCVQAECPTHGKRQHHANNYCLPATSFRRSQISTAYYRPAYDYQ